MHATASAQRVPDQKALNCNGILLQALRFYRAQLPFFLAAFLVPAAARCLWTVAQFSFIHHRHPNWPVAGLLINADWGLSLYWPSIVLTWAGWFLYLVLLGPCLAATSRTALKSALSGDAAVPSMPSVRTLRRGLGVQLTCILRAWAVFIIGLLASVLVGATLLASNADVALLLWYALVSTTFLLGLPIGIRLSLRYALAVAVAVNEKFKIPDAIERSRQMMLTGRSSLFAAISLILLIRLALGIGVASVLGYCSEIFPDTAALTTFLLLPFAHCLLDSLSGPLLGAALASLYAHKAASELGNLCSA